MKQEQSFDLAAPLERVWAALIDVERVAPCLPGAAVTGRNDDGSYTGEFKVKIGPTSAAYSGRLHMEHVDEAGHTATMQAAGTDTRGQGGAKATIVSTVTSAGDAETTVAVSTDYHITGRLARFGRGGMIEEISASLLGRFAENLQAMLSGGEAGATVPADPEPSGAESAPLTGEPDDAIDGATPVAGATPDIAPAPEREPISPVGSLPVRRVKDNPALVVALALGFLVALRVLRRRS